MNKESEQKPNKSIVDYIKSLLKNEDVLIMLFDNKGNEILLPDPRKIEPYVYSTMSDESKNYIEHIKNCIDFKKENEIILKNKKIEHNFSRYVKNDEFMMTDSNIKKYCKYFCDEEYFLDFYIKNREETERVLGQFARDKSWLFRRSSVNLGKKGEAYVLSVVINGKVIHVLIEKIYGMGWKRDGKIYTDLLTCIENLMIESGLKYKDNISFFSQ